MPGRARGRGAGGGGRAEAKLRLAALGEGSGFLGVGVSDTCGRAPALRRSLALRCEVLSVATETTAQEAHRDTLHLGREGSKFSVLNFAWLLKRFSDPLVFLLSCVTAGFASGA